MQARAQDLEQYAQLFRALADVTRLQILVTLMEGELSVSGIAEALNLPQPLVSHHLGLLRILNLVTRHRDGKRVLYGLDPNQGSAANALISPIHGMLSQLQPRES